MPPNPQTTAPISLDELANPYVRGIVYGCTGVGKSIFTCTSQTMRTFLFDVDDGAISVKAYINRFGLKRDMIQIWKTASYQDFLNGFSYLCHHIKEFDLAVVDTATELQQYMLAVLRDASKIQVASQREWGIAFSQMEEVARSFRHLPIHVIWNCHEKEKQDEYFRRMIYRPNFQGQFGDQYGKHFSEIWRYCLFENQVKDGPDGKNKIEITRAIKCNKDQFVDAKDRSLGLSEYEHPNIDNIFYKMMESITKNNIDMRPNEGE